MVYKSFLEAIRSSVQQRLGNSFHVELRQVLKNNGNLSDGLFISSGFSSLSPMIYLNAYYAEAENGLPLPIITEQIALLYEEQAASSSCFQDELEDFNKISDRIVYKLISVTDNRLLLEQIPHRPFLDLAIVFYLIVSQNEEGQMTALVHNEHLKIWNVTENTLFKLAGYNTPRLMPPRIAPIEEVLLESGIHKEITKISADQPTVSLYVLTNQSGINGAGSLLYTDLLMNFASQLQDDLIILPSSIHEVLLTPCRKAFTYEELNELVSLINHSEVPDEDRLSDHVYRYSRDLKQITIPIAFPGSDGKMNLQ